MFLSYSQRDLIVAEAIRDKLTAVGASVFLDRDELHFGGVFRDEILPRVEGAAELVALLTPSSLTRAWAFAEIGVALRAKIRIVGIMYGEISVSDLQSKGVMSLIGDIHHVFGHDQLPLYYAQVGQRVVAAG